MKIYKITKGQLITLWVFGVLFFLGNLLYIADQYSPYGFSLFLLLLVPAILIFYTVGWKSHNPKKSQEIKMQNDNINDENTSMENQPKSKKSIDHAKRIRSWSIFYLVLSAINVGIYSFIMVATESMIFGIFMIPTLIMAVLAYLMLRYKNRITAGIFLVYYLLIFLINLGISSVSESSSAGSLLFLIGLIGIFQCYSSAKKLAKK